MDRLRGMTVAFSTLGCKANQYDTASMERMARERGWTVVPSGHRADIHVVNTCTVTGRAEIQCRHAIRRVKKMGASIVVATGCYAQVAPGALASMPEVDAVAGLGSRGHFAAVLDALGGQGGCPDVDAAPGGEIAGGASPFFGPAISEGRTRAVFKVQEGCDRTCSFCVIPRARGKNRSLPLEKAVEGIRIYRDAGLSEVVLTGIHLGSYGVDLAPRRSLAELVRAVSDAAGNMRIRLSSLDPHEVTRDILSVMSSSGSLCHHLHIALQSGDGTILRSMKRPYTPDDFIQSVMNVRACMPQASIGVDVIAGFPGETDEAYENTRALLKSLPVSYLHVFPFSRKKGTPADTMAGQVPSRIVTQRAGALRELGREKKHEFLRLFGGKTCSVLVERSRDKSTGFLVGYTHNYLRVHLDGPDDCRGKILKVTLSMGTDGRLRGVRDGTP